MGETQVIFFKNKTYGKRGSKTEKDLSFVSFAPSPRRCTKKEKEAGPDDEMNTLNKRTPPKKLEMPVFDSEMPATPIFGQRNVSLFAPNSPLRNKESDFLFASNVSKGPMFLGTNLQSTTIEKKDEWLISDLEDGSGLLKGDKKNYGKRIFGGKEGLFKPVDLNDFQQKKTTLLENEEKQKNGLFGSGLGLFGRLDSGLEESAKISQGNKNFLQVLTGQPLIGNQNSGPLSFLNNESAKKLEENQLGNFFPTPIFQKLSDN